MQTRKRIILTVLLFSFFSINLLAQSGGNSGSGGNSSSSGTIRIWEPDLVELWIYWHKTQYRMFTEFAANEDSLQRNQYSDYEDYMQKLAEMDKILFSQYQNNTVPNPIIFTAETLYAGVLVYEIGEDFANFQRFLNEPPINPELTVMFAQSASELYDKLSFLMISTSKVILGNRADNLRDNRIRDDLMNNIIEEMVSVKYSLNSLFLRMNTAKQAELFKSNE